MTYASEVLADSPHTYWRLGEPSGSTAADASGNGHTGTIHGTPTLGTAGLVDGDSDTAYSFAAADYVQSNASTDLSALSACTLEAIVKTTDISFNAENDICAFISAVNDTVTLKHANNDGTAIFSVFGTSEVKATSPAPVVAVGTTVHLAGTWDGATARLYVNGVLSATGTGSPGLSETVPFCAGAQIGSFTSPGVIDEVAFYTTALSLARIAAHYDASILSGVYRFTPPTEDTVSNVAYDAPGPPSNKLMRYYPTRKRGRTVWKIDETTFSFDQPFPMVEDSGPNRDSLFPYPPVPASGIGTTISNLIAITYHKVFYGGHVYYLDDALEVALLGTFLSDNGYTATDWLVAV